MNLLDNLKWRYATKSFDSQRKTSNEDLNYIKESIQLSASSYGLQPYKVMIIENKELRKKLQVASWNQPQITEASHLLIFCNYTSFPEKEIDSFIYLTSITQNTDVSNLNQYSNFIKEKTKEKTANQIGNWSKNQTYIAMSNLLVACAELKIDACPMEGFDNLEYNKILNLDKEQLNAAVIVPIGYRSKDDHTQNRKKVRKPLERLFINK
jgi:nitroreductase